MNIIINLEIKLKKIGAVVSLRSLRDTSVAKVGFCRHELCNSHFVLISPLVVFERELILKVIFFPIAATNVRAILFVNLTQKVIIQNFSSRSKLQL